MCSCSKNTRIVKRKSSITAPTLLMLISTTTVFPFRLEAAIWLTFVHSQRLCTRVELSIHKEYFREKFFSTGQLFLFLCNVNAGKILWHNTTRWKCLSWFEILSLSNNTLCTAYCKMLVTMCSFFFFVPSKVWKLFVFTSCSWFSYTGSFPPFLSHSTG